MKSVKLFALCLLACASLFIATAQADPNIVITYDHVETNLRVSMQYNSASQDWENNYAGPTFMNDAFRGVDLTVESDVEKEISNDLYGAGSELRQRGSIFSGKTYIYGARQYRAQSISYENEAYLRLDWTFTVQGGSTSLYMYAEDYGLGDAIIWLYDDTIKRTVAFVHPNNGEVTDAWATLIDSHVYRLVGYSLNSGVGDPYCAFTLEFGTGAISFSAPEAAAPDHPVNLNIR